MKMTIDAGIMQDMFKAWNRDYYTYEACEALIEWYDEIDPDTEFDVIGVCCDWNEYGNTPCLTWGAFCPIMATFWKKQTLTTMQATKRSAKH